MIIKVSGIFLLIRFNISCRLLAFIFNYLGMETVYVTSSAMSFVGYNFYKNLLMIGFISDEIYYYFDVPHTIYIKLLQSDSKGKFFNTHIKDRYNYKRLG